MGNTASTGAQYGGVGLKVQHGHIRRKNNSNQSLPKRSGASTVSSRYSSAQSETPAKPKRLVSLDFEGPRPPMPTSMTTPVKLDFSLMDEEEDVCPTCLEEYCDDNPKIATACGHPFHLSCILEWKARSDKCPVCSVKLEFGGQDLFC